MSVPLTFYQYHYMDYCNFVVNPKIKLYKPFSFVLFFFFCVVLVNLVSFHFHTVFKNYCINLYSAYLESV